MSRKRFTLFVQKVCARKSLPTGKFRLFRPLLFYLLCISQGKFIRIHFNTKGKLAGYTFTFYFNLHEFALLTITTLLARYTFILIITIVLIIFIIVITWSQVNDLILLCWPLQRTLNVAWLININCTCWRRLEPLSNKRWNAATTSSTRWCRSSKDVIDCDEEDNCNGNRMMVMDGKSLRLIANVT